MYTIVMQMLNEQLSYGSVSVEYLLRISSVEPRYQSKPPERERKREKEEKSIP
jgi:hypothetical protein